MYVDMIGIFLKTPTVCKEIPFLQQNTIDHKIYCCAHYAGQQSYFFLKNNSGYAVKEKGSRCKQQQNGECATSI